MRSLTRAVIIRLALTILALLLLVAGGHSDQTPDQPVGGQRAAHHSQNASVVSPRLHGGIQTEGEDSV